MKNSILWTAVVTPFHPDGSVDYSSFQKTLKAQENAQNGVVVLGSTGEGLNLSRKTAMEILDFVKSQNLKVPVMAGVPGYNFEETIHYVHTLNQMEFIHAYLVVTPLYAKPGDLGQESWFRGVLDASMKPCMLYNVPGRSGVKMSFNAVEKLHGHHQFWAIKEASGSVADFQRYQELCPTVEMYSGDDGLIQDFRPYNLKGLVSVASNPWPNATKIYVEKVLNQTLSNEDTALWKSCCDALFIVANPVPAKVLMHHKGLLAHPQLLLPLSHLDLPKDSPKDSPDTGHKWKTVLEADRLIENWYQHNQHNQHNSHNH